MHEMAVKKKKTGKERVRAVSRRLMPRGRPPKNRPSPAQERSRSASAETAADFFAVRSPAKRGRPCKEPPPPPPDTPIAPLFIHIRRQLTPEELRERLAREAAECERIVARMTADCAEVNPFFRARAVGTAAAVPSDTPGMPPGDAPCRERDESPALAWPGCTHVHQTAGDSNASLHALPLDRVLRPEPDYAAVLAHEFETLQEEGGAPVASQPLPESLRTAGTTTATTEETEFMDAEDCFAEMDLVLRHKQGDTAFTRAAYAEVEAAAAAQHAGEALLWAEKYRPRSHQVVCGNGECFAELSRWLGAWTSRTNNTSIQDKDKDKKEDEDERTPLRNLFVVEGPGCCCKTAGVQACAEEHGMEVIELSASEARSGRSVVQRTAEAAASQPLAPARRQQRVFVFEDVDVVLAGDSGLHGAILALAQTTPYPVVATCRTAAAPDLARLCASARCAHVAPPPAAAIAHRALLVLLRERGLLARTVPRARTAALVCAVRALAALLAPSAGLRGLTAALHLAATTAPWAALHPAALVAAHIGLRATAPVDALSPLANALETAHGAGCDVGFDSWLRWPSPAPTGENRTEQLWRTTDGYSLLDVLATAPATSRAHRGAHLARVGARTAWRAPRQTLPTWSRLGACSCALEAAHLVAGRSAHCSDAHSYMWHIRVPDAPSECDRAHEAVAPPAPRLLRPGALPGVCGGLRMAPWLRLCDAAQGPCVARWAADVLPALRAVCTTEAARRTAGTARRFVHHLAGATPSELAAVAASGFTGLTGSAGAAALLRCDCCVCPLVWRFLR